MSRVMNAEPRASGPDTEGADSAGSPLVPTDAAIREQVERVLNSQHFRNSKRSQSLLRFVTENLLEGHKDALKEKIIGVEVFGRNASYDTSHDAIVRNAAIEVRKRLAQYYMEPEHAGELRVGLPPGSYAPSFTPAESETEPAGHAAPSVAPPESARRWTPPPRWLAGMAGMLIALAAAFTYLYTQTQDIDRFWAPLFRAKELVQICVGQPGRLYRFTGPRQQDLDRAFMGSHPPIDSAADLLKGTPIAPDEIRWIAHRYLYMLDAFSMTRLASLIQARGGTYRLRPDSDTSFSELRRSPVIVIGGFNSRWALRFGDGMRFIFDHRTIDGIAYNCITDKRDPDARKWMVPVVRSGPSLEDYAVVTRVFDPTTERTVVMVAGIEDYGTLVAGEFITDPGYMNAAFRAAPPGWHKRNIQLVLHTRVIEDTPGPATVVAMHFW
jgi:hypothetical protein